MVPAIRPGIISLPNVLSGEQVQQVLDLKKTNKRGDADVISKYGGNVNETKTRQSTIWWIGQEECWWLMAELKGLVEALSGSYFGIDLDSMERMQLTEYAAGGHCKAHIDSSYQDESVARRKLSLTIQLSDPASYDGGDLRLYPDTLDAVVAPRDLGAMTLFRSHVLHEVTPVTRGVRTSLVAWFSGPAWR